MSTSRLLIYNGALTYCGERTLASLTVNEEGRRLLDDVWNDGGVRYCLEQGQWKFATRAAQFDYDASITPDFGLNRGFTKPTDWVATDAVCSDEFFNSPVTRYVDEAGFWFADLDTLYIKYISDDASYGTNYSIWPSTFTDFVKAHFAAKIIRKLSGGKDKIDDLEKLEERLKRIAKNKDAMAGPPKRPAMGSWLLSRQGRGSTHRDGGNLTGPLIG